VIRLVEDEVPFPPASFKKRVVSDLKEHGECTCVSFYPRAFLPFLNTLIPESKSYTRKLHSILKSHPDSDVCRNVCYKVREGSVVKRSFLMKRDTFFGDKLLT
jgi:hypothetical protein